MFGQKLWENSKCKSILLLLILPVIVSSCASGPPPTFPRLPRNSLAEKITAVENHLPVKSWYTWKKATLFERMEHYNVPGVSVAVISNDVIEWAKGYGTLEVGSNKPVSTGSLFQAASIGKSLTAAAAMQFVEKGYIGLDQNVNEKLLTWKVPENWYTTNEKVTLRRLLSHTAGMTVHGFRGYSTGEEIPTLQQILDGKPPANNQPVRVEETPGKTFSYSGGGYQVVQQLFEVIKNEPFPQIMRQTILEPSGMTSSDYEISLSEKSVDIAAVAHNKHGNPVEGKWHNLACFGAGGGLWTTPTDLALFGTEISKAFKGRLSPILSQKSAKTMLTGQSNAGKLGQQVSSFLPGFCNEVEYGLGFVLCGEGKDFMFLHPGHNLPGYRSLLAIMPEKEQGIVIMINGEGGNGLILEIFYSFAQVYNWMVN